MKAALPKWLVRMAAQPFPADLDVAPEVIADRVASVHHEARRLRARRAEHFAPNVDSLAFAVAFLRPYRRHPAWKRIVAALVAGAGR